MFYGKFHSDRIDLRKLYIHIHIYIYIIFHIRIRIGKILVKKRNVNSCYKLSELSTSVLKITD